MVSHLGLDAVRRTRHMTLARDQRVVGDNYH
jgi:hypothetical protein